MSAPAERGSIRFDWLQAGRGLASVLVVAGHAALLHERRTSTSFLGGISDAGTIGVYFFFVLSGFIVYWVHQRDIGHPARTWRYTYKRVTRVYPMYWLVTLAILPAYLWFPDFYSGYDGDPWHVVRSLALWPMRELPVLSVGWTLIHEMLFYAAIGLAIGFGRRLGLAVTGTILTVSAVKFVLDWGEPLVDAKYVTGRTVLDDHEILSIVFSRFNLLFAVGAIVAIAAARGRIPRRRLGAWLACGSVVFAVPMMLAGRDVAWAQDLATDRYGVIVFYGLVSGALVWVAVGIGVTGAGPRVPRWLEVLGDASYSIYLVHYPVLIAVDRTLGSVLDSPVAAEVSAAFGTLVATVAGIIAYRMLERPMLAITARHTPAT